MKPTREQLEDKNKRLIQLVVEMHWMARDGMGRRYDGLSEAEATPGTPETRGEKP